MISNRNITNDEFRNGCITIGRIAPDFTASSTEGPITLSQFRGKWVLLFYEPGDFLPTATSELIAFAEAFSEFERRNVQLLGVTINSNSSDIEWLFDIYLKRGIKMPFPLLSDRSTEIAQLYDIVSPDKLYEISVRDVFILDPAQYIRAIITYPISCGLNIYELLRVIDSLQVTEQFNLYTPSNWIPGAPVLVRAPQTLDEAIERWNNQDELGLSCYMWYYCLIYLNSEESSNSLNGNS